MTTDTPLKKFELQAPKEVFHCPIFKVDERLARAHDGVSQQSMFTIRCSDWVNVVPVTATGQIVLIEQHRFGTDTFVLETPGGAVDPGEKDTTMAALRELEEETGLTTQRILSLPGYLPNPAIQNNRITYFVAFDVQPLTKPSTHVDPFESIRLHIVPVAEAMNMARTGRIGHALSALALLLAEPMLQTRFATTK